MNETENLNALRAFTSSITDLNALHRHDRNLYTALLANPLSYIPGLETERPFVPVGYLGQYTLTPRLVGARHLNRLISCTGIVTGVGCGRQKLLRSVHYRGAPSKGHSTGNQQDENTHGTEVTQNYIARENVFYAKNYKDKYMISDGPVALSVPQEINGASVSFEYGLSTFEDSTVLVLQEMPEDAPPGQMPRSVEVVIRRKCEIKAGDRIKVYGVYKSIMVDNLGVFPTHFKGVLIGYNIEEVSANDKYFNNFDEDERKEIDNEKEIFNEKTNLNKNENTIVNESKLTDMNIFNNMYKSTNNSHKFEFFKTLNNPLDSLSALIAPSVFGHAYIKKAILLMLLSGTEKIFPNNSTIRSSINILLIGDPSTAKSQILRFTSHFTNCISTTGRGSSGVGLTACVVQDKETGEKRLEAGAMVLSDKGLLCIDEFDKMNDNDRVSLHEAMEQQTVSINKAGINATLNARCSVLAAANPVLGTYCKKMSIERNVGLPVSLLTRFDIVFVVLDEMNEESDKRIAERVMENHSHSKRHNELQEDYTKEEHFKEKVHNTNFNDENQNYVVTKNSSCPENDTGIKNNNVKNINDDENDSDEFNLFPNMKNIKLLKEYINFCKNLKPCLTKKSQEIIVNYYSELRQKKDLIVKVTPRTIETLIRLSSAHAKLRMSLEVLEGDVYAGIEILNESLFINKQKKDEIIINEPEVKKKKENQDDFKAQIEKVTDALFLCREMKDSAFVPLDEFLCYLDMERETVKKVLVYLDEEEIIIFCNDLITFLN
ncbi:MCM DNA helicase complex subunit [Conglomerata obtusa]